MPGAIPAGAVGVSGPVSFSLTPSRSADGHVRPYFETNLAPGESEVDTVVVSNEGKGVATIKVSASTGVTSPNGGSAFTGYFRPCAGVGCWVRGLPASVTMAPGVQKLLRFTVTVPPGTRPRQYLAGITAQPAKRPPAVKVGGNGGASAHAVIVDQVSVGVAVTVGKLRDLRTRLEIPSVHAGTVGPLSRLYIRVRNAGQTFARATGEAACTAGGRRQSWSVVAETLLPGAVIVLPINAPRLPIGSAVPCTVELGYGDHPIARWSGNVEVSAAKHPKVLHTGPGIYASTPSGGIPGWLIAVLVAGGLLLVGLSSLVVILWRRGVDHSRS